MDLVGLLEQAVWANHQWIEFVYAHPDPEPRPRQLLAHIVLGEVVWFDRIDGRPNTSATDPLLTREELVRGLTENAATFRRLIASDLDHVIEFRRASGEEYHARVRDILYHLITHGYHHRGQLAAHYARQQAKYPNTDHINYLLVNRL